MSVLDDKVIDQIVAEVLAQLRQRIDAAPSPSRANGKIAPITSSPTEPKSSSSKIIELSEPVITAKTLKDRVKTGATIHLAPRAILTPSAQDYIRSQKISLSRGNVNGHEATVGSSRSGIIVAAYYPGVVQSFLADIKKQSKSWTLEMESGTRAVVDRVRSVICRGESKQALVFVKNPHQVACLANRNSQCRAAVVQNGADVARVRSELGANILCLDLRQPTYIGLRDILRASEQSAGQIQEPQEP